MGVSKHKCVSPYRNFVRFEQYLYVDCSQTEGVMQLEGMRGRWLPRSFMLLLVSCSAKHISM
jgi:hypothetical protein